MGLGFMMRDDQANVVLAGKKEEASGSSTLLESYTMRYAPQMAKQYGLQITKVESDIKTLTDAINGKQLPPNYCDVVIGDIRTIAEEILLKC